jgi:hypothetical protein
MFPSFDITLPLASVSNPAFLAFGFSTIFSSMLILWICQSHLSQIKPSAFSQSFA